jgi:hypothetical protein
MRRARRLAGLLLALGVAGAGAAVAATRGPVSTVPMSAFYDGHKDSVLATDTSNKQLARSMAINFAPGLALVPLTTPEIYFVEGAAAAGQLHVLGSQPGESDYSPIWRLVQVRFKAGHKPVLLTSDTQIGALAKKGVLTEQETSTRINCPVIQVGVK